MIRVARLDSLLLLADEAEEQVRNMYEPKNRSRCHCGAVKCIVMSALTTAPQCTEMVKSSTIASACGFK
jgi:hypothetical protein